VASIVAPSTAAIGQGLDLDGSDSSDPDGDSLKYYWALIDKPAASTTELWGERNVMASFTPDVVGDYLVELTVSDGELEAFGTVTITAEVGAPGPDADAGGEDAFDVSDAGANQAPIADAGDTIVADVGTSVTLDGSNSFDPDGDSLTYKWTIVHAPVGNVSSLLSSDSATPRITPTAVGYYEIELTVSDGELTATDSVIVDTGGYPGDVGPGADAGDGGFDGGAGDAGDAGSDGDGGLDGGADTGADAGTSPDAGTSTDAGTSADTGASTSGCLIISEYVEGSSNNKAVELYNCGSAPIDLTDYRYCSAQNGADPTATQACSGDYDLTGTMAGGDVLVLCHPNFGQPSLCDASDHTVSFNGNDRFAIYLDDGSDAYEHGVDTIVDAFGQLGTEPGGDIWAGVTFDRCNFAAFDGVSSFDASLYYHTLAEDDFSGLGVAPSETCAP
jgi:hypothetical protein